MLRTAAVQELKENNDTTTLTISQRNSKTDVMLTKFKKTFV